MTNYVANAETLFRDFARRHSLTIEKLDGPAMELAMCVPQQPGLSFELFLGLQNEDELNIGFAEFWSYFFPCEKAWRIASEALATGECRLAIHTQRGRLTKHVLEQFIDGQWGRVYTAMSRLTFPFLRTTTTYLYNEDARPRSTSIAGESRTSANAC